MSGTIGSVTRLPEVKVLDADSHEQLYYQLYNIFFQEIVNSAYSVGQLIPSETELVSEYNVSRATVRKAMEMLVSDGLVERRRGVGSVVVSNRPASALHWMSSCLQRSVAVESDGPSPFKRVLSSSIVPANDETSQALGVPMGTRLFRLDRVRCSGDDAFYRETAYLAESYAPSAIEHDFSKESLRAYYTNVLHVAWPKAVQRVYSANAGEETAGLLGISPDAPILVVRRVSSDVGGVPREYIKWNYRSDYYYLEMTLGK